MAPKRMKSSPCAQQYYREDYSCYLLGLPERPCHRPTVQIESNYPSDLLFGQDKVDNPVAQAAVAIIEDYIRRVDRAKEAVLTTGPPVCH